MSWEHDKGILIFMGVLVVFIIFCGIMAVRSAKKQKQETATEQRLRNERNNERIRYGFVLFLAMVWLTSSLLTVYLYETGLLNQTFKIPRILTFFYDVFGIRIGAIIQAVLSLGVIVETVRSMIKKHKKVNEPTCSKERG